MEQSNIFNVAYLAALSAVGNLDFVYEVCKECQLFHRGRASVCQSKRPQVLRWPQAAPPSALPVLTN